MNRFSDTLKALRERASDDDQLRRVLEELPQSEESPSDAQKPTGLRLPYSSDAPPIEDAWN